MKPEPHEILLGLVTFLIFLVVYVLTQFAKNKRSIWL